MILFDGGFIKRAANGTYTYHYNKTDHLGNVRAVLQATGTNSLTRVQRTDYYPFGLAHEYQNTNLNRYLYNGKELQTQTMASSMWGGPGTGTFNVYDFGSRFYNPVLGRWSNIDPRLQFANPYLYAANNPAMFVDPDGEITILAAALIGAAIGTASYTLSTALSPGGFDNWNWGQFGKSLGFGALSGVATLGIGEVFGATGGFMNEVGRGLSHGLVQGGSAALQGGDFWSSFASGAIGSWAGHGVERLGITKTTGGLLAYSSVSAGVSSWAMGGNFWQGAANGLMVAGLNQVLHKVVPQKRLPEGGIHEFASKELALEYMKKYSYDSNGNPYKEHMIYVRKDGTAVLMPTDANPVALPGTYPEAKTYAGSLIKESNGYAMFRNGVITESIHTHFTKPAPGTRDSAFYKWVPKTSHSILLRDSVYNVWP